VEWLELLLFSLSECASKYAVALGKPFSEGARGACIPTFPSRASEKVTAISRGTFSTGTAGIGFIALSPTTSNSSECIYYTSATYSPSIVHINPDDNSSLGFAYGADVKAGVMSQIPYEAAVFTDATSGAGPTVNGRIVSYGVRVRYIGTQLDMGGRMTGFVSPAHSNLNGSSYHGIASRAEAINLAVSREWSEMAIFADTSDETEYPGHAFSIDNEFEVLRATYPLSNNEGLTAGVTGKLHGGIPLVFIIDAKAGVQFEFEVVAHTEYIGKPTASRMTRSHCDIAGLSMVQNAANGAKLDRAKTSDRSGWKATAKSIGQEVWEHRRQIGNVAAGAYKAYTNPVGFLNAGVRAIMN